MKRIFLIALLGFLCLSCLNRKGFQKPLESGPQLTDGVVTFIIKHLPKKHDFNDDIFISGDFEGWSGGKEQFKLKKDKRSYSIVIPKYKETISFKFTKGAWGTEECQENGSPIENRIYSFKKIGDTIDISILNWNDKRKQNKLSTASENVRVFDRDFEMPQLARKRKIMLYLPPDYHTSKKTYPVLYVQDGQNVFDISTSYSDEWEVDETMDRLFRETGFGLIVVAIDHGGSKRLSEYSAWDHKEYGKGEAGMYLDFLANTLKPEIDKNFRTKTNSENTVVMGSSMGGLFAHYAIIEKPDVFGKAGVFSPSFWYAKGCFDFTKNHVNSSTKIYYLAGDKEGGNMVSKMNEMVSLMKANGFPENNVHKKVVPEGTHSESFWKREFEETIRWLFKIESE